MVQGDYSVIPEQRLSTEIIFSSTMVENPQPTPLLSRERGGVALQDPSQGLQVRVWECTTISSGDLAIPDQVIVYAEGIEPVVLFSALEVTEVSLAFDQNMRPFVAFVSVGAAKYYWYDSAIEDARISDLPAGSSSPRATLDDHRLLQSGTSDIIMVYIRDGNLYFRAERDRYTVEYLLRADINLEIISPTVHYIAMNHVNRLQISVRGNFYGG